MPTKFNLSDDERAKIRRSTAKTGFLTLVDFREGPRGARYRSVRSGISVTEVGAARDYDEIVGRRWKVGIRTASIVTVDALGNVLEVQS